MSSKIEEFDEEKENEETKKNVMKGKEVFHEWEHLIMNKLLRGCRCRQWKFLRFSSSPESEDILSGNRDRYTQCKLCDAAVYGGVYGEVAGMGGLSTLPRFLRSSRSSGVERQPAQLNRRHLWTYTVNL